MRIFVFILLFLTLNFFGYTQGSDQLNLDSLVHSHLSEYSEQTGNAVTLSDSAETVYVFFELLYLDSVKTGEEGSAERFDQLLKPRPGVSLFQLLYFDEGSKSFQKRTIDTLDANSGWSGCHYTDVVDSAGIVKHGSKKSLALLMCHPVKHSCNSMTFYYMKSYTFARKHGEFQFTQERLHALSVYRQGKQWREDAFKSISWAKGP